MSFTPLIEDPHLLEGIRLVDGIPVIEGTVVAENPVDEDIVETVEFWRERAEQAEARVVKLSGPTDGSVGVSDVVGPEHVIVSAVCGVFSVGQSVTGPWFPTRGRGSPVATERSEACPLRPASGVASRRAPARGERPGLILLISEPGRGLGRSPGAP